MKRRILGAILSLALAFNMVGTVAFAQDTIPAPTPPGASNVEKLACTCPPVDSGDVVHIEGCPQYVVPAPQCNCTVKCTAETTTGAAITGSPNCPVCGAEGADFAVVCKGKAPALLKSPRAADIVYSNLGADGDGSAISATLSPEGIFTLTGTGRMKEIGSSNLPWNGDTNSIKAVVISSGITYITESCFYHCQNLTSVTFEDGSKLDEIGVGAFKESGLASVSIPAGVTKIGFAAFSKTKLASIVIPNSVKEIGQSAFSECTTLTNVTFQKGSQLNEIDKTVFAKTAIKSIEIPASVKTLDASFQECVALKSVTFEEGTQLETIGGTPAFLKCTALESITLPASVATIGEFSFYGCSALTSVTFKGNAPTLGNTDVFTGTHTNLKIYIPNGATDYTGGNWDALADKIVKAQSWNIGATGNGAGITATLSEDKTTLAITGSGAMKDLGGLEFAPWHEDYKGTITTVTITEGITNIGDKAFLGCAALTSITIPESVTIIGNSSFSGCNNLASVTIPVGVESIGKNAFYGCTGLTSVTIPEGSKLKTIGGYAFYKCTALTAVTIPVGVTSIGDWAFKGSTNLKSVTFKRTSAPTLGEDVFTDTHPDLKIYIPKESTGYKGEGVSAEWIALKDRIVGEDSPTVTGVTVTPAKASVQKGTTKQFSAKVTGTGNPDQTVTWSVDGGMDSGVLETSISPSGLLTVIEGETAKTLTIIVTSTADPTKRGTATVTITDKGAPTRPTPPTGGGGGGDSSYTPAATPAASTNVDSKGDGKVISSKVTEEIAESIAATKKSGTGTRANIVAVNPVYIAPQTLQDMAAAAAKAGGTAWLFADSVVDHNVMVRVYINTANAKLFKENILLGGAVSGKDVDYTKNKFAGFDNKLAVVSLAQQKPFAVSTEIAAKVDLTGLNTKTLHFYSYDKASNFYYPISAPSYWVDKNGYLHFNTTRSGNIIITDKPLTLKK